MRSERWNKIESIFHKVLDADESRRSAVLEDSCAGDESLRREVESLLAHHKNAGDFIETPAFEDAARAPSPANDVSTKTDLSCPGSSLKGALVAHYRVLEEIGVGGMGVVYKAEDTKLGRAVALKFLPERLAADSVAVARFRREARAASSLNHPNICTIYDIAEHEGREFIAMEYLEGRTLATYIAGRALGSDTVTKLGIPIAEALSAAHSKGVIHRDVKPGNIFITASGLVKVLDFGVAKLLQTGTETVALPLTERNVVTGTLAYMSPEQLRGEEVDARSDIFSLGVVLYEMSVGRRPYTSSLPGPLIGEILDLPASPPSSINRTLPPKLDEIILKALEKDPELRYQSAGDLCTDLKRLQRDTSATGRIAVATAEARRPRAYIWVGLAALLVAAAALALYVLRRSPNLTSENVNVVPLTSYPGEEQYPSFSPDGNEVAFSWNGGENGPDFDLYRKQIGSENAIRLTTVHSYRPLAPAWSPDGRSIAFIRLDDKGSYLLALIPALGGPERRLSEVPSAVFPFTGVSWSPDSKWLAFPGPESSRHSDQREGARIYLLNVETLERRILPYPTATCAVALGPIFSWAGDRIASYCSEPSYEVGAIYIQSLRGNLLRKFEQQHGDFEGLAWTADDKSLIYCLNNFLWRVPASGGLPERTMPGQNAFAPVISRTVARLAYAQQSAWRQSPNIWRLDLNSADRPKGPAVKVISSSRGQEEPRISPDGRRIAFYSGRSGSSEIWVAGIDGSNLIQLTSFGGPLTGTPRWSPDSRHIVFDSRASGHVEIYMVDADGGPARRLPTGTPDASQPSWSHDGRWIYFYVSQNSAGVWKVPAEGGTSIQLATSSRATVPTVPQESIDGTRVFYITGSGRTDLRLKSVSVNGGDEREYPQIESRLGLPLLDRWTPGPNGIYFLDSGKPSATLNLLDLSSGKIHRVADVPGRLSGWGSGLSLSADGRTMVFATNDRREGDLMLVEGFH